MRVAWAATSVESGRFTATEQETSSDKVTDHFSLLRSQGRGYFEIRGVDAEYPVLTIGFRDEYAVIHQMGSPDETSLLEGDGTVASGDSIEVPIMDEFAEFTGDFVFNVDHAWRIIQIFMDTASTVNLGSWSDL